MKMKKILAKGNQILTEILHEQEPFMPNKT